MVGTYAKPPTSKNTLPTPVAKATAATSARDSPPTANATGIVSSASARSRSATIMTRRFPRLSNQCPTRSGKPRFGSHDAVATRLTPPGPAPSVSAATRGSVVAVTWLPK
jgi:hypothetical protein